MSVQPTWPAVTLILDLGLMSPVSTAHQYCQRCRMVEAKVLSVSSRPPAVAMGFRTGTLSMVSVMMVLVTLRTEKSGLKPLRSVM